jgi:DNA-binding GntR family transcriptional regulator
MKPQKEVAAAATAAADLRHKILSGGLKPGTPLREVVLIQELNVSRNTLREAFLQLTLEGLTEQQLYRGTVVRRIEADEVRDIFVARRAFEFRAIERSSFASQEDLAEIKRAVEKAQEFVAQQAWAKAGTAGMEFHQAIVRLLGSRKMDAMFEVLCAQMRLAFAAFADEGTHQAPWLSRDVEICDHLLQGKRQDALHSMEKYLDESEQTLLDALRQKGFSTSNVESDPTSGSPNEPVDEPRLRWV